MPSPAAARASASAPTPGSPTSEVNVARVSVSGPTWTSRCGPTETLGARWSPKADKAASPSEGATPDKAAGSRKALIADTPAAAPVAMAPVTASTPSLVTTVPSASPSTASVKGPGCSSELPASLRPMIAGGAGGCGKPELRRTKECRLFPVGTGEQAGG
ncbi:hypothetical protein AB1E18_017770 [Capra hircus]